MIVANIVNENNIEQVVRYHHTFQIGDVTSSFPNLQGDRIARTEDSRGGSQDGIYTQELPIFSGRLVESTALRGYFTVGSLLLANNTS